MVCADYPSLPASSPFLASPPLGVPCPPPLKSPTSRPFISGPWRREGGMEGVEEAVPRRFIMRGQHTQKTAFKFQSQTRPVGPPRRV